MVKIAFGDDTEPAISADILNQLQTNVETAINKKDIINATVQKSADETANLYRLTSNDYIDLPLIDGVKIGNYLGIKNGKILVGDNVSHIKISGQIYFFEPVTNGIKEIIVKINQDTLAVTSPHYLNSTYTVCNFPSNIVSVNTGDIITLSIKGAENDKLYANNKAATWITVEVID